MIEGLGKIELLVDEDGRYQKVLINGHDVTNAVRNIGNLTIADRNMVLSTLPVELWGVIHVRPLKENEEGKKDGTT